MSKSNRIAAAQELQYQAGQIEPFQELDHDSINDSLAIASSTLDDLNDRHEDAIANVNLIQDFVKLLPKAAYDFQNRGLVFPNYLTEGFMVGFKPEHATALQASVLWIRQKQIPSNRFDFSKEKSIEPYYVMGQNKESGAVLLTSPQDIEDEQNRPRTLALAPSRIALGAAGRLLELRQRQKKNYFAVDDAVERVNELYEPEAGMLCLWSSSKGSIELTIAKRKDLPLIKEISDEQLESFNVNQTLRTMAIRFGLTDQLTRLYLHGTVEVKTGGGADADNDKSAETPFQRALQNVRNATRAAIKELKEK